jgi:hypothetical protein
VPGNRRDQPVQCGARRQDDPGRAQQSLRPLDQLGERRAIGGDLRQVDLQAGLGLGGKRHEAEVVAHPGPDGAVGRRSRQRSQFGRRRLASLTGQMDENTRWQLAGIIEKAAGVTQVAQMQRGPQPALRTAGARDLRPVGVGQRPVPQQPVRVEVFHGKGGRLNHRG